MIDPAMDWGGLKDSENAPNSFFPKINRTLFWQFGTDMTLTWSGLVIVKKPEPRAELIFFTFLA